MNLISIVTPCFNEEGNIEELYRRVKAVFSNLPNLRYEHIFIDNDSSDQTISLLKKIAQQDKNVKLIINSRNFGAIRSPFYGMLQANGDAIISLAADLQDPPEMISSFIEEWSKGTKIVVGVKKSSQESQLMFAIRKMYYHLITKIASVQLIKNFTGFGLYDRSIIDILSKLNEPYPYFRGLISEIGFEVAIIPYAQPARKKGVTKFNFFSLYDYAMLGITSHSKMPLRIATLSGFLLSLLSLSISIFYLFMKLIFWYKFHTGIAPILIGLFFFSSVQLFFIGLLGEYIISIQTRIMKRPLVIEKERINFE